MTLQEVINAMRGAEADFYKYADENLVDVWESWYKGKAPFHTYYIYNGKRKKGMTRKSLGMAKKCCEDWASLLLNEKTDIAISHKQTQENVNEILADTKFWSKANDGEEKSFALGYGAVVQFIDVAVNEDGTNAGDGKIKMMFFNRKRMKPVVVEDGEIVECAFFEVKGGKTKISLHRKNEKTGNYEIINALANGVNKDSLELIPESAYTFDTKSPYPLFMVLQPNISNNIDIDSPFGISVFANAIDHMESIDIPFDSEANEFTLGRKRIFASVVDSVETDPATGETTPVFDANDVVFYQLPPDMDGKSNITNDTQPLRIEEHERAIQAGLNRFSAAVGFGNNRYKYDQGTVTTATQVISENSDMFRNIRKHEILLNDRLIVFIKALMRVANEFTNYKMDESANIEIKFDDSIIEDKEAQKSSDRVDVGMGVMSKAEYRSKWYNENLETAQKAIDEISAFNIPDYPDEGDVTGDGSGE